MVYVVLIICMFISVYALERFYELLKATQATQVQLFSKSSILLTLTLLSLLLGAVLSYIALLYLVGTIVLRT